MEENSTSYCQDLLEQLRQKGYITWERNKPRTYRLLGGNLPLLGRVEAGYLIEHPEGSEEYVHLSGHRYSPQDYALLVSGDSMIDAHICDGDVVVMQPMDDLWALKPDQIGVVWIDGEGATLKYVHFREGDDEVVLTPANRHYPTRTVDLIRVQLQGVLIRVHRDYGSPFSLT